MKINKFNLGGIILGGVILLASLFFYGTNYFFFILGMGVIVGLFPFILQTIYETSSNIEKEDMFLEFARNLVESVKTGTPISKSILNVRNKPYGLLSPHVKKLANQISWGIPFNTALQTFARDVNNPTVSKAITLIGQAEKAGGDIGQILEAVAGAVSMSDKIRKERKAAISTLVVQGYIIFLIFIVIVLVMQFKIIPMLTGITMGGEGLGSIGGGFGGEVVSGENTDVSQAFLYMMMVQGFFSGLAIGKLSEGNVKSGIKHSFALAILAFIISSGANLLFGGA
jgi:archaeal flagellar protein FlaJ